MKDSAVASPGLASASAPEVDRSRVAIKPIIQVVAGNALEIYDFMIYGYYARYIAQTYFPSDNEYISLMMSLMTFAFGFLARPVGAIVLGAYTDRHGRRKGLILALSLMSLGIISVACTPSYASIGIAAPIIVLLGRLMQGFSAGAELGGVVVYLAEIAPARRRAFYTCWQAGSQQISVMVASLVGLVLLYWLTQDELHAWGWRVPLLLGCMVIPVMFWLRSSLQETSVFAARKRAPKMSEICTSLVSDWRTIVLCMGMVSMATVTSQTITTYAPTFIKSLNLGASAGFIILFFGGLSVLVWLPIMALVADRFNRRTVLIVVTLLAAVTAYPLMSWLATHATVLRFAVVELWFSFIYAAYSAVQVAAMVELVPPNARTSGYAFAQAIAAAVLGGFTPAILTWLTHTFHSSAMVGVWLAINAAISLAAALCLNHEKTGARQKVELH
ncbi:tricarballylate/proton symporter TcuC [Caballeronia sp. LZ002]|uniref:tricarballylate/proton symporter TcuC n=1 Tax=unclassified Caballeronia TaxID=2646786 RepID=UPI0020295727|nr:MULTISPECIES: tricarballylate/proton symporter TcuC [unclassified Caballeronia]MDR5773460.1 tricarballylate/proton symporter TcuC [Caballeronia sp. LZ002]